MWLCAGMGFSTSAVECLHAQWSRVCFARAGDAHRATDTWLRWCCVRGQCAHDPRVRGEHTGGGEYLRNEPHGPRCVQRQRFAAELHVDPQRAQLQRLL